VGRKFKNRMEEWKEMYQDYTVMWPIIVYFTGMVTLFMYSMFRLGIGKNIESILSRNLFEKVPSESLVAIRISFAYFAFEGVELPVKFADLLIEAAEEGHPPSWGTSLDITNPPTKYILDPKLKKMSNQMGSTPLCPTTV
jgi:hypothetical protein